MSALPLGHPWLPPARARSCRSSHATADRPAHPPAAFRPHLRRRSEEDIGEIQREISMLKQCQNPSITRCAPLGRACRAGARLICTPSLSHLRLHTFAPCRRYFGSAVVPGTSQLWIVMELMAASAADVVRPRLRPAAGCAVLPRA